MEQSFRPRRREYGKRPYGWNVGDIVETQDPFYFNRTDKMIVLAAIQAYRLLPQNREDHGVADLCKRLEYWAGLRDTPD